MNIDNMHGDTARQILKQLVEENEISLTSVQERLAKSLIIRELADLLHTMICDHSGNCDCTYYTEELNYADKWKGMEHIRWCDEALSLMDKFNCSTTAPLFSAIYKASELASQATKYKTSEKSTYYIFCRIMNYPITD
jgi:hypothetical protein